MINIDYPDIIKQLESYVKRKGISIEYSEWKFTRLKSLNHNYNKILKDSLNRIGDYEFALQMGKYVLYLGQLHIDAKGNHKITFQRTWLHDLYVFSNDNILEVITRNKQVSEIIKHWNGLILKLNNINKLRDAI